MINTKNEDALRKKLQQLHQNGELPTITRPSGYQFNRVQDTNDNTGKPFTEGYYFGTPTDNLGRYNDPNHRLGVTYLADDAATALAEAFRREVENGYPVYFSDADLDNKSITSVSNERSLRLLDLGQILPKLNLTVDVFSGNDYSSTQQIVGYLSDSVDEVDGIAYRSRHYDSGNHCYALFKRPEASSYLITDEIVTLRDYTTTDVPEHIKQDELDGEEILTEVLNCKVRND